MIVYDTLALWELVQNYTCDEPNGTCIPDTVEKMTILLTFDRMRDNYNFREYVHGIAPKVIKKALELDHVEMERIWLTAQEQLKILPIFKNFHIP